MALTDENGMNYSMPVAPMNYGGGFGNGFGGDGAWLILFISLMMNGGWGNYICTGHSECSNQWIW